MYASPPSLDILTSMPSPSDFYAQFWNRKPFVVRGGISPEVLDELISADELAGLSLEEAPQSRLVKTVGPAQQWSCRFGPFSDQDFAEAGDRNWTLLVQNVEQFHPETANLLRHFGFTPRWLMDDIMVSYSEPGGSVGPHIDNYHVFLVQGQGKRHWKVGRQALQNESYIQGIDFRILEHGVDGDEVELSLGDVLYLPPRFAHEGTTIESALTFSVGFLGPKVSELLSGYAQSLAEREDLDQRYVGAGLDSQSAGFLISPAATQAVQERLIGQIQSHSFSQWLAEFFTESSHENFGDYSEREDPLERQEFVQALQQGASLIKPEYVKFAITQGSDQSFYLGFDAHSFVVDESLMPWVSHLMQEDVLDANDVTQLLAEDRALDLLADLYNHQALEFK
jgi:50S ribosomal protein L16 3-hydroxylase